MRVIVTKYALAGQMGWVEVKAAGNGLFGTGPPFYNFYGPGDYATTEAEAIEQFHAKRAKKLASLRKQIAKLEAMEPVIREKKGA